MEERKMMGEKWMKWTILEATMKTSSKIVQKTIGVVSSTFGQVAFATFVVGLVQTIAGYVMAKKYNKKIFTDKGSIAGSIWFGLNAMTMTVLCFAVFLYNGDMGVNTFIITLSIIPGALIDTLFFGHKLNRKEWAGIGIATLAGYSILGWPSLHQAMDLPSWVWLSFIVMMLGAINQGITQKIKKIDPFVKNF